MRPTPSATKENGKYYPVIKDTNGFNYILNEPKNSRSQAITAAKNKIKTL